MFIGEQTISGGQKTEKPPFRRLIVGDWSAGQKGTTMIVRSRKHTWPMVTTSGSMERVRFVFMCSVFSLLTVRNCGSASNRSVPIERSAAFGEQVAGSR